jgi:chitinase
MAMARLTIRNRAGGAGAAGLLLGLLLALLLPAAGVGQATGAAAGDLPATARLPVEAETGFLQSQGALPRFQSSSKVSGDALTATLQQRVASVPYFAGSFPFEGRTFPFTIVGKSPKAGGITQIPTQIVALSMLFEGFVDDQGDPVILDSQAIVPGVEASPIFRNASYQSVGLTQFADAVQRAQFFRAMSPDWHTLLAPPELLKPVTIDVPRGMARVYRNRSLGVTFAVVDTNFFISQLNTVVQLENLRSDALALVLTNNIFLAPKADAKQCCVLGFHTSFATAQETVPQVQTLVWASWIDPGLLGSGVADITPISHEISEWMNNPFGTNIVPSWQILGPPGGCQNNLETADPVAALPNAGFPVAIDGVTYHPQTQVLLPWFTRQGASDSLDGAFSFPDERLITSASQSCTMR